jgi:hypothetical protein
MASSRLWVVQNWWRRDKLSNKGSFEELIGFDDTRTGTDGLVPVRREDGLITAEKNDDWIKK